MSKANQKFVQADEAVSPVIGVILMVAITVVLAAVVFVLVSNLSKTSGKAPDLSFSTDETQDRIQLIKSDTGLNWNAFQIKMTGVALRYAQDVDAQSAGGAGTTGSSSYQVFNAASFNAGNFIDFCRTAAVNGETSIQILHTESNTIVYDTKLVGTVACA